MSDVRAAFDSARVAASKRWPGLSIDASAFRQLVTSLEIPAEQLSSRLATRGSEMVLAAASALGDAVAIAALDRDYIAAARSAVQRHARDAAHVDEILQQLRIHMLVAKADAPPRIARFDGRAALGAWISMYATRLALTEKRNERAARDAPLEWSDALAELPAVDPIIEQLRVRHAERVAEALRTACESLSRRHRAIIRLLFVEGASVDDAAAMYQVHRVTIWRMVQDAREQLGASVRAQLTAGPELDHGSVSLIVWVMGQVDLSLDGVLAPTLTASRAR